jgi:hypothetical protein
MLSFAQQSCYTQNDSEDSHFDRKDKVLILNWHKKGNQTMDATLSCDTSGNQGMSLVHDQKNRKTGTDNFAPLRVKVLPSWLTVSNERPLGYTNTTRGNKRGETTAHAHTHTCDHGGDGITHDHDDYNV